MFTCSPQFEKLVVPEPVEATAVSPYGSILPVAAMVIVLVVFCVVLVPATTHFNT